MQSPTKRTKFSKEDDEKLIALIRSQDTINWDSIALYMGNKNARQCRDRWNGYLNPAVEHGPWTKEEDSKLVSLLAEYGRSWTKISSYFPNRTDSQLKNRYNQLLRKDQQNQAKKIDIEKPKSTSQPPESSNQNFDFIPEFGDCIVNL